MNHESRVVNSNPVMLSIPPNTGSVERAYSVLENIMSEEARNRLEVGSLKHQLFLAVLKLPVTDSFGYSKELEFCK